jgi:hypothetical protein
MKRLTLFQLAAILVPAIALAPGAASAQDDDTLSVSGTFRVATYNGTIGADLG